MYHLYSLFLYVNLKLISDKKTQEKNVKAYHLKLMNIRIDV